jgi:hypothetical protein
MSLPWGEQCLCRPGMAIVPGPRRPWHIKLFADGTEIAGQHELGKSTEFDSQPRTVLCYSSEHHDGSGCACWPRSGEKSVRCDRFFPECVRPGADDSRWLRWPFQLSTPGPQILKPLADASEFTPLDNLSTRASFRPAWQTRHPIHNPLFVEPVRDPLREKRGHDLSNRAAANFPIHRTQSSAPNPSIPPLSPCQHYSGTKLGPSARSNQ